MSLQQLTRNKTVQIPALIITVTLMLLFPYLIHLVGGPVAGTRWLPMFYAPFVAAILFNPLVAVVAGLSAPFLNYLITGAPPLPMAAILSFELALFGIIAHLLYRRWPAFWGTAPLAYLLAKISSALLLAILPVSLGPLSSWQFFSTSIINAIPGLLILLLINWLLLKGIARAG
jgi:hypothetical protein